MSNTIDRLLEWGAAAHPNRVAATLDDETATFGALERRTNRLVRALQHWGVKRGDRLLWQAPLSLRHLDVHFAAARIGATFIPANPAYSRDEMRAVVDYVQPHWVLVDASSQAAAEAMVAGASIPLGVIGNAGSTCAGYACRI